MSEQSPKAESQNLTWPTVTGAEPAATDAVRVTMLPLVSDVTGDPLELRVRRVVVLAGDTAHARPLQQATVAAKAKLTIIRMR